MDYLKLPTIVKTGSTRWRGGTLSMGVQELVKLRSRLLDEILREFAPDAVLVDHMPVGALGELKGLLDRAANRRRPPRLFLGLRDVLDDPAVIRPVWRDLGAYEYLGHYERVLVYGCETMYDSDSAYGLSASGAPVTYCNYVGSRTACNGSGQAGDRPYVLVMGGGGGDSFPVAQAFLAAYSRLREHLAVDARILTGPNMPEARRAELHEYAQGPGVAILNGGTDARALVAGAAAVVTMAGYNSLCEVLAYGRKALVVPRPGPSAEQSIRTRLFVERALVHSVDPERLTPEGLCDGVLELSDADGIPERANIPPLDGAMQAASILLGEAPVSKKRAGPAKEKVS